VKIAIVGFDIEGKSSYEYLTRLGGHKITICDQNPSIAVPAGAASQLGDNYLKNLDAFDVIVRTAGLQPSKILAANPDVAERITSHINLFYGGTPTNNIIGITGTKGKGTTSTLVYEMLKAAGKEVQLGGNIGIPPLSFVDKLTKDSWVVLELSSFQLIDCRYSPQVGVCLMVVPEHLNWHTDMDEYVASKSRLFAQQSASDTAVFHADTALSEEIAGAGKARLVPYMRAPGAHVENGAIVIDNQTIVNVDELKLLGEHNWQNACAAVTAVWEAGVQDVKALRTVLRAFSGLEHRLEFVREVGGVKYYNDSFGTTPETAMVAIQAFAEPKIVVLGGSDKGADYTQLAKVVASGNVRSALLIGETAPKLRAALEAADFTQFQDGGTNMAEIMNNIVAAAQPGDVVLLSTGNASFDMFENYKDRGEQFKSAVQALA
jgi:UDP-N-acetylmuramoylalanine--D-glutamate ligase